MQAITRIGPNGVEGVMPAFGQVVDVLNNFEPVPTPAPMQPEPTPTPSGHDHSDYSRAVTIKRIRTALRKRSGKAWRVYGHTGTAYGWFSIKSPDARCVDQAYDYDRGGLYGPETPDPHGHMSEADRAELSELMGGIRVFSDGVSVASSHEYYAEHIDRAEGVEPCRIGTQYWD